MYLFMYVYIEIIACTEKVLYECLYEWMNVGERGSSVKVLSDR